MMVAAISGAASADPQNSKTTPRNETQRNPTRPPLLPSEKDNAVGPRRPKSRPVSSRYMSPSPSTSASSMSSSSSSSRRYPSPLVPRNSTPVSNATASAPKRSASVDRRRPVTSRSLTPDLDSKVGNGGEVSAATRLLVTSTRSLSVSFQGESFSLPISKTKVAPPSPNSSSVRKGTPERRRTSTPFRGKVDVSGDQVENSKPVEQQRWPARTRQPTPLWRSLDCSVEKKKLIGSGNVIMALQQSMIDETRRASFDGRLSLDLGNAELLKAVRIASDGNSAVPSDFNASDSDSVSSGSSASGQQECGGVARARSGHKGIAVSARFWQETNSRLRRLQDPSSPMSVSTGSKIVVQPRFVQSKKFHSDSTLSSPRTMSSPVRAGARPASPNRLMTSMSSSPLRGMPSPSRVRSAISGIISGSFSETPSVLSFAVDVRRGKVGENRIVDAHLLRLLYNRHLQWRFVNARTEAALLLQKRHAEKNLWNAWITISDLRDSVTKRKHRLQLLRQKLKLVSILKGQISCLEDWASLDNDHSVSLLGAIEALKASTFRLPVLGGAVADIGSVRDAMGSAVEVMQAMTSSLGLLLSKVEEVNSLVTELAKVTAKERALLAHCKYFLSMFSAMQVRDCSLRAHILQQNWERTA